MKPIKMIFYSLIMLLVTASSLYWFGSPQDSRDSYPLYFFVALIALNVFYQTYLLIYDVSHKGVTATPTTIDNTSAATETPDPPKVEKKEIPRWKVIFGSLIVALVCGYLLYWYGNPRYTKDYLPLYFLGGLALAALVFFHQTYLLFFETFHPGVAATPNTAKKTTGVMEASDLQKVEGNEVLRREDGTDR